MHPFGERLASSYEGVDYEDLQEWFCDGFGWGQIMLALETSEVTGDDFDALLERRGEGEGWGEIWQDLELIGQPEDAEPLNDEDGNGRPDFAGPPEWVGDGLPEQAGPPEWVGDGRAGLNGLVMVALKMPVHPMTRAVMATQKMSTYLATRKGMAVRRMLVRLHCPRFLGDHLKEWGEEGHSPSSLNSSI
jgi:hypothetical protein